MSVFDQAWAIVKADTGMWDEIYAPLHEQLVGRGLAKPSGGVPDLDFLPTSVAMDVLNSHIKAQSVGRDSSDLTPELATELQDNLRESIREQPGDQGFNVDDVKQSILEHGFRIPNLRATRNVIPNFSFDDFGRMKQGEGRHRTMALHELGAPYIPSFGSGRYNHNPAYLFGGFKPPYEINPIYSRKDKDGYTPSQYSAVAYYGPDKGKYPVPPSFAFNQELVPGMGRLVPVIGGERISDEEMTTHIGYTPDRRMEDWVRNPEWAITHDD